MPDNTIKALKNRFEQYGTTSNSSHLVRQKNSSFWRKPPVLEKVLRILEKHQQDLVQQLGNYQQMIKYFLIPQIEEQDLA